MGHTRANLRSLAQLAAHAVNAPQDQRVHFVRPSPVGDVALEMIPRSFADLERRACVYGGALLQRGMQRGDRVILAAHATEDAVCALLGMFQVGLVPVPLMPPLTAADGKLFPERVADALRESGAKAVVSSSHWQRLLSDASLAAELIALESLLDGAPAERGTFALSDSALVLLGDGPTATITLTHADVLSSLELARQALDVAQDDVFVSWLPLSQDAGMLAALLPFYCQTTAAFLSTVQFFKRPSAWLQAIAHVRGTLSFAPPQAYLLCVQRIRDPHAQLRGLDLSCWRTAAGVGAPTPIQTANAFSERFGAAGFRPAAFVGAPDLMPFPRSVEAPISHGQKALWFLAQLSPDSVAYNMHFCLRIASTYDAEVLRAALETILTRHAALRTVFGARAGVPYRKVLDRAPLAFEAVDAEAWSEAVLAQRLTHEVEQPFDLERGPLFAARLFTRGPSEALLLFAAHHINVDGMSLVLIATELAQLYPRLLADRAFVPARAPAHNYDDFVLWQAQLLAGAEGARLRAYWKKQLSGVPVSLALPTDHPRPAFQGYRGAAVPVRVPDALVPGLRALAQRHETTLYTVLLASFQVLLQRLSEQRDLLVATPGLGRSGLAFSEVVGYFANALPIRSQLTAAISFETLLAQLRGTVFEALDHQDLPFSLIVEQTDLPRDPSRLPLCQVLFQLHTHRSNDAEVSNLLRGLSSGDQSQFGGLVVAPYAVERRVAQFDLALDLADYGSGVAGRLEYNSDLFEAETAHRWAAQFLELTQALLHAPGAEIDSHPLPDLAKRASALLAPEERSLVLEHWNDTTVAYDEGLVHRAIERQAALHPERIALSTHENLSYGELNRRANRMARQLRLLGAGPDALVGVCMDRSIELVTVLLAIMKAGAAYVPLDPSYPRERLHFMERDAEPCLIIADDAYLELVQGGGEAHVMRSSALHEIAGTESLPADDLTHESSASDLVYMIYTSGSTGAPKGVGNTHAGLWNRLRWMQSYFQLSEDDCVLQKTPYSFDVSVWELFWPLMSGARLAIAKPEGHKDSRYLRAEIARQRVTTLHFVPSMLEAFLQEPELAQAASVRRVICSGEALSYATLLRCLERLPGAQLYNLYGPTEASIDVSAWKCEPNARGKVLIGRPIANTQLYILDEQRQPVAIGTEGELYIGGVGLARGYHRRPELTAERFVANPFSRDPDARLYKAGDLARFDGSGAIEYLGRNDDQIKLRGFRIELGEIEAVFREHPSVETCAVAVRRMPSGATQLEAFIVETPAADGGTQAGLESWLRQRLPEYMLPARIVSIDAITLTHSGKADRRALLERALPASADRAGATHAHVAPSTPEQRVLAEVWEQVLGVRGFSVHDNYFALGGDSIRSLQVSALARQRGLDLDVQALLTHQTIAELAASVATKAAPEAASAMTPFALLRPSDRATLRAYADAFPATQLQLGMLYHSELTHDSWAYHDVLSLELEFLTDFHQGAMCSALEDSVKRHPALRSCFDVAGYAQPLQLIQHSIDLPLTVRDLRALDADASHKAIRQYIERDKARAYDLARGPLFRVMLHLLSDKRVRFTLGFHHAILDGWSVATLLRELFSDYLRATGVPGLPQFEPPVHSFSTFVALENQALADPNSRAYFACALEAAELTRLPRWPESQRRSEPGSARLVLPLSVELGERLRALAAQQRAPLKALLMAAHARTLAAFTGVQDVVTGWVTHGRPELPGAERILGLFLNTLPVRFKPAGASWAQLIAQVVQRELELHAHRRFPLHEVQRSLEQRVLFETAFNFVNFHQYEALLAEGSLRVGDYESQENTGFALMVNFAVNPADSQLTLHLEYDAQQIANGQAEQIARAHLLALEHMANDIHALADAADLLDARERAQLEAWSQGDRVTETPTLHARFEQQVARTPERVAVQFGTEALEYAELDAWANQIALQLQAAGAQPAEVISVCAEPSVQRAAAVLGVLKAGCAILPLDAEYPRERLEYMLDHADVRLALVTHQHADADFLTGRAVIEIGAPAAAPSLPRRMSAGDPAYVIYTSGSTGRPKAILMPHAPLSNIVGWQMTNSAFAAQGATAQFSLFSFDISFQEMFSTWACGGRLVIVPDSARKDARELAKLLFEQRIARLFVPVVALHQLAEIAEQLQLSLPELREINSAGEQLEISTALRAFFVRHPQCRLQNQYGPSETHVATSQLLAADPGSWPITAPIGRPLPGVRAYVLEPGSAKTARRLAPLGVPGELFLAGPCVGIGYCNDPERTAERFQLDPFEPASGTRMYETGDLVRYLPGGNLEYVGRRDGQLKIRGYRVELGEVESAIVALSEGSVQRAVVVAVPGRSKAVRYELAAYIVREPRAELDLLQLKAALARRLPAYMLPSTIQLLDALPIAPSGKLDRRALPRSVEAEHVQPKVPPANAREAELCGLWQEVLVTDAHGLGVTDDFFASGGDSLSAVRLMARVQRRFDIDLPISALIEAPTVRELARVIDASGPTARAPALVKLGGATGTRPPLFCVHPIGGHVLCYMPLARRLGADQPFYGVQARGLSGRDRPHTSVLEMASAYAAEILAAQPYGPLHIAGWSFGGMVAVELARQLVQAGRELAPVVLIDSVARVQWNVHLTEQELFACVVMELFGVQIDDAGVDRILARDQPLDRDAMLGRLVVAARERGLLPDGASGEQFEHVFSVIQSNMQAAYDYEARVYDGPVLLLRCTGAMPARLQRLHDLAGSAYVDASNGWSQTCPNLEVLPVRGDHLSIVFEPHVHAVAETLQRIVTGRAESSAAE